MADFRQEFYRRYVTTFKGPATLWDRDSLEAFWRWCGYAYGPILQSLPRTEPILELGCGAGYLLEYLRQRGFSQVEGIDISAEQVALATDRGLAARIASANEFLESHRNSYQAILAIDFIEHFSKDELLNIFPAIHRALKESGILVLQTPNGQGLFAGQVIHGDLTHVTIFNPGSLLQLLQLTGFAEIRLSETNPFPIGFKGHVRRLLWQAVKWVANGVRRIESGKTQAIWTETLICTCRKGSFEAESTA